MAINNEDLTRLMNQARIKLIGASDAGIKNELFEVFTEFFDISSCWTEQIDLDGMAYQKDYDLTVSEGRIIRLGGAAVSSLYSTAAALAAAEAVNNGQSLGLHSQVAFLPTFSTLHLENPPSSNQALRVTVVKNVSLPTARDGVPLAPDWVLPIYSRYILAGVLGNMMNQPQKSYSNDTVGTYNLKRFQEGIARARVAAMRANTAGAQAWSFPQGFRTRSQRGFMNIGNGGGV
jgi:hypothetical protein